MMVPPNGFPVPNDLTQPSEAELRAVIISCGVADIPEAMPCLKMLRPNGKATVISWSSLGKEVLGSKVS